MAGITESGVEILRLNEIKQEIELSLQNRLGVKIDLDPETIQGQLIGIFSEREAFLWEKFLEVFNSQYPDTSSGVALDNVGSLTGVQRQSAQKSSVILRLIGTPETVVDAGSQFSDPDNINKKFEMESSATIQIGLDDIQTINFSAIPVAGTWKIQVGSEETGDIAFNGSNTSIQNALQALPGVTEVNVSGNYTDGISIRFTGEDAKTEFPDLTSTQSGLNDGSVTVTVDIERIQTGKPDSVDTLAVATDFGSISALAGTITKIENPVFGLDSVTNQADAVIGRERETDAEFKVRRIEDLQRAGSSTLGAIESRVREVAGVTTAFGIENDTNITDADGRPAKSFEIVALGGQNSEIAQKILDSKPAGIETFGNTTESILDNNGFSKDINFSRPTEVPIFATINVTTTSSFPSNGADIVKEKIIEYGESLSVGDLIVISPDMVATLRDITGVVGATIEIGRTSGTKESNNIQLTAVEISTWIDSNIIVNASF